MDTMLDVRSWVATCLYQPLPDKQISYDYDLYTTPPRTSLPNDKTLQTLGLVPAAIVYVSWRSEVHQDETDAVIAQRIASSSLSSASLSTAPTASPGGWNYLSCVLFDEAHGLHTATSRAGEPDDGMSSGSNHKRAFPTGRRLVDDDSNGSARKASNGAEETSSGAASPADDSKSDSSTKKKPKWLKV